MQRQSLGSPGRERHVITHQNDAVDHNRRESTPASAAIAAVDIDEIKPEKPHRFKSQPEKLIHLIPVLLVFCFVVLYFFSHDPSPRDLAQFDGKFNKHAAEINQIIEIKEIDEIIGNVDKNKKQLKRSGAFVIRSQRNLKEEITQRDLPKIPSHRKLADF